MTEKSFASRVKGYGFIAESDLRQISQIPKSEVNPTMPMHEFGQADGLLAKQVGQDALLDQTVFYANDSIDATIQPSVSASDTFSVLGEINNSNRNGAVETETARPETLLNLSMSPDQPEKIRSRWAKNFKQFLDKRRSAG